MENLQRLAQDYLRSQGYKFLQDREGFLVADKADIGGDHDTRLLWVARPSATVRDFRQVESGLLKEFQSEIPQFPHGAYSLLVHSLEGFSR